MSIYKTGIWQQENFLEYNLPSEYIKLDYVQSDGTQYIDTGIKGNAKHYYELAWLREGLTRQLMGYGGSSIEYWGLQNISTGKLELGGATNILPSFDITQRQVYEWRYNHDISINQIYANGALILSTTAGKDVTNISIKFLNLSASVNSYVCNLKIYSYIIKNWENEILAYYIPAKRKNDNKIGLYEVISQTFVLSGNGNEFIAGPETDKVKLCQTHIEANNFIEM